MIFTSNEKAILTNEQKRAYEALGFDPKKPGEKERDAGRLWMCKTFSISVHLEQSCLSRKPIADRVPRPGTTVFCPFGR